MTEYPPLTPEVPPTGEVPDRGIRNRKTRRWLYRIVVAGCAIAAAYGVVNAEDVPLWTTLAAAILGVSAGGLADANVPE